MKKNRNWTEEDLIYFKEHYATIPNKKLSQILLRSIKSIENKAHELKLYKTNNRKLWNEEETKFLKENSERLTIQQLSEIMGRSDISIRNKIRHMKLHKIIQVKKDKWTKKEIKTILNNYYGPNKIQKCKDLLPNRSKREIKYKAQDLRMTELALMYNKYRKKFI